MKQVCGRRGNERVRNIPPKVACGCRVQLAREGASYEAFLSQGVCVVFAVAATLARALVR